MSLLNDHQCVDVMLKKSIFGCLLFANVMAGYSTDIIFNTISALHGKPLEAAVEHPKLKDERISTPPPVPIVIPGPSPHSGLFFPKVNLTQMRLSNGMTLWLKPTTFENQEIHVIVTALGGYANVSEHDRPSLELAPLIAWESGFGELTSDQLTVLLHDNRIEFHPKIYPFKRTIEGVASASGIGAFFQCVKMVFTQQKFTENGFNEAISKAKGITSRVLNDAENIYEAEFLKINTQGAKALQALTPQDLAKVELSKAQKLFSRAFANPSEFAVIVVGDIEIAKVLELANHYLASIPRQWGPSDFSQSMAQMFPPGITHEEIKLPRRKDAITRLTFPWKISMTERRMYKMAITCQIMKARLRQSASKKMKLAHGIDVAYEFPFYPFLDNPWVSIRFSSDPQHTQKIVKHMMAELKKLQEHGINQNELDEIIKLEAGRDEFMQDDNFYWCSMLANYYLWDWDPHWIYRNIKMTKHVSVNKVNRLLKIAFSQENYSVITGKP